MFEGRHNISTFSRRPTQQGSIKEFTDSYKKKYRRPRLTVQWNKIEVPIEKKTYEDIPQKWYKCMEKLNSKKSELMEMCSKRGLIQREQ